ncbi:Glycosyl hydrolase family 3 [Lasiodiplodia theobromae]|uniref:Glycosyl hydrolase family 3 n=1 Tax=Lasiodiplodia theobromae TaxID=45133 RepID=UPI0015C30142|nr:Glycosyl hydrolase family 3 [Lasiodiplodia theobromae]KAF4540335.1 Glycosyl hydrolase family 3 [Lasiodiplodia theobromae]
MASAQLFQRWDLWANFAGLKNYGGGKIPPTSIRLKSNLRAASGPNAVFLYSGASDYLLQFIRDTSPYDPVLELRLSLYVNSKRPTEVLSLWFRQIIDDDQSTAFPRSHSQVPLLTFSDPLMANMPRGPFSFSSSLMEFQYKDFSERLLKNQMKALDSQAHATTYQKAFGNFNTNNLCPVENAAKTFSKANQQ